ncbi:MAG: efflux RND transporter periplasmic adaptor subunit [Flavobacteriaceae bacterium]|nr:efflux RND transporter periplasmic adaptor subunit [Flavobacteriaceae bacterium]
MKKIIYTFGILLFASSLLISCGKKKEETASTEAGIAVEVAKPATELPKSLHFKGKISSAKSTSIRTRGSSFVEEVYVKTGDQVKQGQLLIRLNNADLQAKKAQVEAQLQQVNAQLSNTQRDVQRYRNLREKQSISEKELENMELQLASAQAQQQATLQHLQEVNSELKYFQIKAPFDGVITAKNVQKGDLANPQQAMLQLEGSGVFEMQVSVSERDIQNFQQGDTAVVQLANASEELKAVVSEVSSSSTTTGGQYRVKANILSAEHQALFSGMNASLKLTTDQASKGIFVPQSAIIRRGELKGLYVVSQQETALLRWVRVGESNGEQVEILSGLNADEHIITSATSKLYNGIKVSF